MRQMFIMFILLWLGSIVPVEAASLPKGKEALRKGVRIADVWLNAGQESAVEEVLPDKSYNLFKLAGLQINGRDIRVHPNQNLRFGNRWLTLSGQGNAKTRVESIRKPNLQLEAQAQVQSAYLNKNLSFQF